MDYFSSSSTVPSIFGMKDQYTALNKISSLTSSVERPFSKEEFAKVPVETLWYLVDDIRGNSPVLVLDPSASARQAADVDCVRKSLNSGICDIGVLEAMVRLATIVRAPSGPLFDMTKPENSIRPGYTFSFSKQTPVSKLDYDAMALNKQDGAESAVKEGADAMTLTETVPEPNIQTTVPTFSFLCAYLLRYAYRLPGENWTAKIEDFKAKFADMMKMNYSGPDPTISWANSFNTLSKDLKYKVRIVIYLHIMNESKLPIRPQDIQTMTRYLFSTPFSYFGMAAMNQIWKCAHSLEIDVSSFISAIAVPELIPGIRIITDVISQAGEISWFPYARAFDDSFFIKMSSLSVKKLHFVCLVIINMKGGQTRYINLDEVRSVNVVRDRELLQSIAVDVVTAIELSKPKTSTSIALENLSQNPAFKQRREDHLRGLLQRDHTRVVNQLPPSLDIDSMILGAKR